MALEIYGKRSFSNFLGPFYPLIGVVLRKMINFVVGLI